MARVKRAVNARKNHKKVLKLAKGYYGAKSKLFKTANESVIRVLKLRGILERQIMFQHFFMIF
ncbi:MAG TPA: 50S ribosomal protein L20, partial [Clostridiaceae bacterium]|nr:50S ribosomal protein L20 [Clostridiaceae bacterium]